MYTLKRQKYACGVIFAKGLYGRFMKGSHKYTDKYSSLT